MVQVLFIVRLFINNQLIPAIAIRQNAYFVSFLGSLKTARALLNFHFRDYFSNYFLVSFLSVILFMEGYAPARNTCSYSRLRPAVPTVFGSPCGRAGSALARRFASRRVNNFDT